jgi:hypothetical protein
VISDTHNKYGWNVVGGAASAFRGHGYCAVDASRWMRTLTESFLAQGNKNGTMHPNEVGHQWYAQSLYASLFRDLFDSDGIPRQPS